MDRVRGKDAGSPDSGSIGATEDAATGSETPPGACLNLRTGALVAQPRSGLSIQDRQRLAVLGSDQAARHGGVGRPGKRTSDRLGLLFAGDQEDDPASATQ